MTFDNERARALWAATRVRVWAEPVVLASLPVEKAAAAATLAGLAGSGFVALVRAHDEVSLTIPEAAWRQDANPLRGEARAEAGPFRALTFDLDLALDVCGYLAPAAVVLAEAGVPIVPQCAFRTDHLLVSADKLSTAVAALDDLIARAREGG